jgi:hypothetical protein
MTPMLLWIACAGSEPGAKPEGALPVLDVACTEDAAAFADLASAPTDVATVLRASFTPVNPGSPWVAYADTRVRLEASVVDGNALLVGVGPGEPVAWRAMVDTERGTVCSPVQRAETGLLPSDVPELSVEGAPEGGGGFVLVPILAQDHVTSALVDPFGRVVWAHRAADEAHLGPYRLLPSRDGLGVVAALAAPSLEATAEITAVDWAGMDRGGPALRAGHTDLAELPDGTFAMLGWSIREVSPGRRMLGDTIVEVSPQGVERVVWSVFDAFVPRTDEYYRNTFYTADLSVEDWTHGSGLFYDVQQDDYLVTLRNLSLVVRVDRGTGTMVWAAGGGRLGVPDGSPIEGPHSVQRLGEDSYLVFNNGIPGEGCSRAVELHIDPAGLGVEERRRYAGRDCEEVVFLGDARVQADGSVRVAWSSEGRMETFTAEGASQQILDLPVGYAFGFAEPVSLGRR